MVNNSRNKKTLIFLGIIAILGFGLWLGFSPKVPDYDYAGGTKKVALSFNGADYYGIPTAARTVGDFVNEQKIALGEKDEIVPGREAPLYPGTEISIRTGRKVTIQDGKEKKEGYVLGATVQDALLENDVTIGEDDFTIPELVAPAHEGDKIKITRVEIKEEKETKNIDFKKIVKEDDELSWRTKKVTQAGKLGKKELTYKAVYHDEKLISRKLIDEEVIEEPVEEISTQGTFVKLGKKHDGMASWYAFRGGLFAANPWLPMGSYAKVTNLDNGKSVIVKINDRGPFVPGRIIDLDKVAFQKIASLGAGVVHIKMEEVLN